MTIRVAVTGAGGPSAVSFLQAVAGPRVELFAGDVDPYAPGLYLVHPEHRWILHRGDDSLFVDDVLERCTDADIDVLVPTVDSELLPLARRSAEFERHGVKLLLANDDTLVLCGDNAALVARCADVCPVPRTAILDDHIDLADWPRPSLVRPRLGVGRERVGTAGWESGGQCIDDQHCLDALPHDGSLILQEFLSGNDYSVDVLCATDSRVVAAVPRMWLRIESGLGVTGVTVHDARLEAYARDVARAIGMTFVANIRFREDASGIPRLIDVNARLPGAMPLTVASGVNMPNLALDLALGRDVPDDVGAFREVGMVRVWREHFVEPAEINVLERLAEPRDNASLCAD